MFKNQLSVLATDSGYTVAVDKKPTGQTYKTRELAEQQILKIREKRADKALLFKKCKPFIKQYHLDNPKRFINVKEAEKFFKTNFQFRKLIIEMQRNADKPIVIARPKQPTE